MTHPEPRPIFILETQRDPWRPIWTRIGEYDTFDDALMHVRGDYPHQIVDNVTGITRLVRTRYGGGLEMLGKDGATWERIARPGASKVIGLGINARGIERGCHTRTPNPDEFIHDPSVDVIEEMARRGAAINAGSGKR